MAVQHPPGVGGIERDGAHGGDGVLVIGTPADLTDARRFVATRLDDVDLHDLVDDAELVVSELVTNALLHTGGPAEVAVQRLPDGVRVEVRDPSRSRPLRLDGGGDAATGRGLLLVERLAARWGVDRLPTGKVVWAELNRDARRAQSAADGEALLAMWGDPAIEGARDEAAGHDGRPAAIALGPVPTALLVAAKARVDALTREFALIAAGGAPAAVTDLVDVVLHGFVEPRHALKRLAAAADAAGEPHVDLVLPVPEDVPATIEAAEAYLCALDRADAYCREAQMLTLEAPASHGVFHHWYVQAYVAQLRSLGSGPPPRVRRFDEALLDAYEAASAPPAPPGA